MQLPQFNFSDRTQSMQQSQWRSILNPVLSNPITNPRLITNITLNPGDNQINHGLGKLQQGWIITDINAASIVFRSSAFNDLTLTLTATTGCIISLAVY